MFPGLAKAHERRERRERRRILTLRLRGFGLRCELEMSLGFSRFGRCVLAGLALSWLWVSHAAAQGTQRSTRFIELSETNNAEILTNLNQLTTKKEGFRQLEDQLRT